MELQVGVKALVKNDQGQYLLLRRSAEKYPEVGDRWDIPGGRINPGEALMDNLRREIKEEIGVELMGDAKLLAAQDILRIQGKHVVRLTYLVDASALNGVLQLSDEHSEYGWFSKEEMRNIENLDLYLKELLDEELI